MYYATYRNNDYVGTVKKIIIMCLAIPVLKSRSMTYIFLTSNNTATDTVERNTCKNIHMQLIFIKRDI